MEWTGRIYRYLALNDLDKDDLDTFCNFFENNNLEAAKTYFNIVGYKPDHRLAYMLKTKQLYRSTPLTFNDPFDCMVGIDPNAKDKDILAWYRRSFWFQAFEAEHWQEVLRKVGADLAKKYLMDESIETFMNNSHKAPIVKIVQRTLKKFVDRSRTICFSEDPDNLLMWAHYADKHEGYCLGFDSADLKGINKLVGFYKVKYDFENDRRPLLMLSNEEESDLGLIKKIFLSKSSHWAYEKEIRLIYVAAESYLKFNPIALREIIFGADMPDRLKTGFQFLMEAFTEWESLNHVTFSDAELDTTHFKVTTSARSWLYED